MATPYEVEHNIKSTAKKPTRRPSMSSFFAQLSQIETTNPHALPTPVEVSAAERLLQDQLVALRSNGPNEGKLLPSPRNSPSHKTEIKLQPLYLSIYLTRTLPTVTTTLLTALIESLQSSIDTPPTTVQGVPQSFLDSLDRVPKKALKPSDSCPICGEKFLDDAYPLVVQLPCHSTHRFDLDCVGPWLRMQGTCPLDRKELGKKREVVVESDGEEEDVDDMYA